MTTPNTLLVQELRHRGHSLLRLYGAPKQQLAAPDATLDLHVGIDGHAVVMENLPTAQAMSAFMTERRKLVHPPSGRSVVG